MAKVLLVEDDNNLREIYEARLAAEGYEISAAQDGEEALVVAKQTKPDLVVSDVMMPKISGFEMLDILRNTPGLEHVKVIMLTALGQSEDRDRADSLGADKYLVKSQVTLEDIVKTAHELLDDAPAPAATPTPDVTDAVQPAAAEPVTPEPVTPTPEIPVAAEPAVEPVAATEPVASAPVVPAPTDDTTSTVASTPTSDDTAVTDDAAAVDDAVAEAPATESVPMPEPVAQPEPAVDSSDRGTTAQEENLVEQQIDSFVNNMPDTPVVEAGTEAPTAESVETPPTEPAEQAASEPETPSEPTAEEQAATTADDEIMANAVTELAGDDTPAPAVVQTPETSPAEETSPVEEAPTEETEETPTEAKAEAERTNISISGKKTIQPLESEPKPDINELLAREEAASGTATVATGPITISTPEDKETDQPASTEPPKVIHQPGQSFTPQPEADVAATPVVTDDLPSGAPAPTPSEKDGIDPNSIAL